MSAMEIADVYLHGESPIIIDNQLDLIIYLGIQILSTLWRSYGCRIYVDIMTREKLSST